MIALLSLLVGLAPPPFLVLPIGASPVPGGGLAAGTPEWAAGGVMRAAAVGLTRAARVRAEARSASSWAAARRSARRVHPTLTAARARPELAPIRRLERRGDRWFGEDKLKHFFMSFAATSLAYGSVRTVGLEGAPGLAAAGGSVVALGLGKEWYDHRAGGPFSVKDLTWDAAGIAVALFVAAQTR